MTGIDGVSMLVQFLHAGGHGVDDRAADAARHVWIVVENALRTMGQCGVRGGSGVWWTVPGASVGACERIENHLTRGSSYLETTSEHARVDFRATPCVVVSRQGAIGSAQC